jgi:two-component system, NarL family, response regulator DegU
MAESSLHLKVMLVDDHHLVRFALRTLLEKQGCEIVAEADSADSALKLVASSRPQIVLMDLEMPGTDGITATRHLRRAVPHVKVIFLSAHDARKKT